MLEDTVVILGIVVLNAAVGFVQEFRAERAMAALQAAGRAHRRRGSRRPTSGPSTPRRSCQATSSCWRPGTWSRRISASWTSFDLKLGEAALTGESLPVEKRVDPRDDPDLPVADRDNMAFKGTVVLYGRGRGLVVATGMATELGRIAGMLEGAGERRTPLQQRLTVFGRQIAIAALAICAAHLRHRSAARRAAAADAADRAQPGGRRDPRGAARGGDGAAGARRRPDGARARPDPPASRRRDAGLGDDDLLGQDRHAHAQRDARRRGVRCGRARCRRRRSTRRIEPDGTLLLALALCNDVARAADGQLLGDPTEVALWQAAAEAGIDKTERESRRTRVLELPFDSERKRMTTLHADGPGFVAYTKGAPETVLPRCIAIATGVGRAVRSTRCRRCALPKRWRRTDCGCSPSPAGAGTRCLPSAASEAVERDLTLLGLVGLLDPPRDEAKAAVATCRAAGITPVMITGDHPATARAIARQLGILDDAGAVLTGRELQTLSDAELRRRVGEIRVYARVDPAQKIRIVAALQAQRRDRRHDGRRRE